ncbi:oligomeric, coiled-coil, peripheral membrane protein [Gaertneriomyces sp. JEL0708]|nr:oligomeric, coiled-coil, peripheral membrane protein [Gaertneriomyces sp. JEL0708]
MRKLKVYEACSGVQLPTNPLAHIGTVQELQREIEPLTLVPVNAQILLASDGTQLKSDATLQADDDEISVFIFDRRQLNANEGPRRPALPDVDPPVPLSVISTISISSNAPLSDRCQAYLDAFGSHVHYGRMVIRTANNHLNIYQRLLQELKAQEEALNAALANLGGHSRRACDLFDMFYLDAQRLLPQHTARLQSVSTDLQLIRRIPVHPKIAGGEKCLSDFVPEDKVIKWAERCGTAHEQIVRKIAARAEGMRMIKSATDDQLGQPLEINLPQLESLYSEVEGAKSNLSTRQQRLERDLIKVQELLSDSPAGGESANKLTSIDHLHSIHSREYLPDITKIETSMRKVVHVLIEAKLNASQQLMGRLQQISYLQMKISDVAASTDSLYTSLETQVGAFDQLLRVHRMPAAWAVGLVEIVRRKEFARTFIAKSKDMADVLRNFRSLESSRRESFQNEIGRYLPSGVILGLDDPPPACSVHLSHTTDTLPNIARMDITEFEKTVSNIQIPIASSDTALSASQMQANNPVTKVISAMVTVTRKVDNIAADFDKIVARSGLSDRLLRLEEENGRLRAQLAGEPRPLSRAPSASEAYQQSVQNETAGLRNKIAEYESRLAELDMYRQKQEEAEMRFAAIEVALREEQQQNIQLNRLLDGIAQENAALQREKEEATVARDARTFATEAEGDKMSHVFDEVQATLNSCMRTLRRDPSHEQDVGRHEDPATPDTIRRTLRDLQDDILCHVAELDGLKQVVGEPGDESVGSETLDAEVVALARQVATLRGDVERSSLHIHALQEQLTATEAREAILEAELMSLRTLHTRAENDLVTLRATLELRATELTECTLALQGAEERFAEEAQRADSVNEELARSKTQLASVEQALYKSNIEADNCQKDCDELRSELQMLKEQLRTVELELVTARTTAESARVADKQKIDVLFSQKAECDAECVELKKELAELHQKVLDLEQEAACISSEKEAQMKAEKILNDCVIEKDKRIEELQARLSFVEQQCTQPNSANQSPARDLDQGSSAEDLSTFARIRAQTNKWKHIIRVLMEQLRAYHERFGDLAIHVCGQRDLQLDDSVYEPAAVDASDAVDALDPLVALDSMLSHMQEVIDKFPSKGEINDISKQVLETWRDVIEHQLPSLKADLEAQRRQRNKISFQNFAVEDLALFLPTRNPKAWAAFNIASPHYFLSPSSREQLADRRRSRDYILAYITHIDEFTVDPADSSTNPFGLATRTRFRLCQARPWEGG